MTMRAVVCMRRLVVVCVQWTVVGQCGVRGRNVRRPADTMELVVVSGAVTTHYLSTQDGRATATACRLHRVYTASTVPVRARLAAESMCEMHTQFVYQFCCFQFWSVLVFQSTFRCRLCLPLFPFDITVTAASSIISVNSVID